MIHHRLRGVRNGGGISGTYWRILANDASWSNAYGSHFVTIYEVRFYESTDASGTNLCIGATASASSVFDANYPASYANDNNTGTRWAAQNLVTSPQWWQAQLSQSKAVRSVQLLVGPTWNNLIPKSIKLQVSSNGTNWQDVAIFSTTESGPDTQTFTSLQ